MASSSWVSIVDQKPRGVSRLSNREPCSRTVLVSSCWFSLRAVTPASKLTKGVGMGRHLTA
jgi:hypothetical protein